MRTEGDQLDGVAKAGKLTPRPVGVAAGFHHDEGRGVPGQKADQLSATELVLKVGVSLCTKPNQTEIMLADAQADEGDR